MVAMCCKTLKDSLGSGAGYFFLELFVRNLAMTVLGQELLGETKLLNRRLKQVPETHRNRNMWSWHPKRKVVFQQSIL